MVGLLTTVVSSQDLLAMTDGTLCVVSSDQVVLEAGFFCPKSPAAGPVVASSQKIGFEEKGVGLFGADT